MGFYPYWIIFQIKISNTPFDISQRFYYILSMEQNPIEFIKEQVELDSDTHFQDINWDRFYDILEEAYLMDVKRMESLKDFDTWKEWKNKN